MLPSNGTPWPPARHHKALGHMSEWSAWYSGDPGQLSEYYLRNAQSLVRPTRPMQYAGGVAGRVARWWWGTPPGVGEQPAKLHVPLAADICGTSADLLFSEPVSLKSESESLTQALADLQDAGLDAQLHEAAELQAALGGVYLRVVWDRDVAPLPWTDAVHADMALPEFRWGRLTAVTFWQRLPALDATSGSVVWRLLERHEPSSIFHALYKGTGDNLGRAVPLQDHPDAAPLADVVDAEGRVLTGTNRLTATYVPNMMPNRLDRGSNQGRSDLQGVTPFLDALDEAYSSWWRDIRHAKSRIHMPAQYLDSAGPGQPAITDIDREVYVPIHGVLATGGDGLMMEAQQFKIRVAEHKDTCESWTEQIVNGAGYSTQSLAGDTGGAMTATEVHARERRSYTTRGKKIRYWRAAIREHLAALVDVANANMSAGIVPDTIDVAFPDGVQESALSLAQTTQALRNAEAASTKTRVRMIHPDWADEQVDAEVALILSEAGSEPVPVPGDAGF